MGTGFRTRSCSNEKLNQDAGSTKRHPDSVLELDRAADHIKTIGKNAIRVFPVCVAL
ncbi:hypothetical protein MPL1032_80155 [Mesorhizobium plurifarium]|uniref:Uncharacterized protein n=1 Tax=Mesorhizobium plurifarium TaxID=69974 RepID=A0A0K2W743_MESPL|nr:hypothetical protein MPL1032_80155 [Mesorhizobium plurifarium]